MAFEPVNPWVICDLSGKKVRMSETRKTWDGLRVWAPFWYPKHPQLSLRAIPDRMAVKDARPRPADLWASVTLCMQSIPGNVYWTFTLQDDGALVPTNEMSGTPRQYLELGGYRLYVDDDAAMHVETSPFPVPTNYTMYSSPGNLPHVFSVETVGDDLALIINPA